MFSRYPSPSVTVSSPSSTCSHTAQRMISSISDCGTVGRFMVHLRQDPDLALSSLLRLSPIDNHGNRQRSLRASRLHSVDSMIMPTAHHDAIRSRDAADSKARTIGIKGV